MVELFKQSKGVENASCHSGHFIPFASEIEHQGGCVFSVCEEVIGREWIFFAIPIHPRCRLL